MFSASANPRARTLPSPSSTVTATPRGTSIRCLTEQSAITPEHFIRSTSRSPSIAQVTLGSDPIATLPCHHRVTSIFPAGFESAATTSSAESSESMVRVRPARAKVR
jgi:hypothetical protein